MGYGLSMPYEPRGFSYAMVRMIGLNETLLFEQLSFHIETRGVVKDGRRWVHRTVQEIHETDYPCWSIATINRILKNLRDSDLLITTGEYNRNKWDTTLWYAINKEALRQKIAEYEEQFRLEEQGENTESTTQNDKQGLSKSVTPFTQIDKAEHRKLINPLNNSLNSNTKQTEFSGENSGSYKSRKISPKIRKDIKPETLPSPPPVSRPPSPDLGLEISRKHLAAAKAKIGEKRLTTAKMIPLWGAILTENGFGQSLSLTAQERGMLKNLLKSFQNSPGLEITPIEFLEFAVEKWSSLLIPKLGGVKRLGQAPTFKMVYFIKDDIIRLMTTKGGNGAGKAREKVTYTCPEDVPLDHPDRERLIQMINIVGRVRA